jgi:hypothetical protein
MHLRDKINQAGATGYILLCLLGIPIQFCSSSFYCAAAPSPSGVLIPSALVRSSLGIVSHVSFKPSHH